MCLIVQEQPQYPLSLMPPVQETQATQELSTEERRYASNLARMKAEIRDRMNILIGLSILHCVSAR